MSIQGSSYITRFHFNTYIRTYILYRKKLVEKASSVFAKKANTKSCAGVSKLTSAAYLPSPSASGTEQSSLIYKQ